VARTNVPITDLLANAENENPASTAIDAANNHVIPAGAKTRRLLLRIVNTFAGSKTVTIKAGVNPPSVRAGIGDLAVVMGAQNDVAYVVLESARFAQANGDIYVDVAAATTGSILALRLPAV
jgi:hypothetical protein